MNTDGYKMPGLKSAAQSVKDRKQKYLDELVAASRRAVDAMTPAEMEAMLAAQRVSYGRSGFPTSYGPDGKRTTTPFMPDHLQIRQMRRRDPILCDNSLLHGLRFVEIDEPSFTYHRNGMSPKAFEVLSERQPQTIIGQVVRAPETAEDHLPEGRHDRGYPKSGAFNFGTKTSTPPRSSQPQRDVRVLVNALDAGSDLVEAMTLAEAACIARDEPSSNFDFGKWPRYGMSYMPQIGTSTVHTVGELIAALSQHHPDRKLIGSNGATNIGLALQNSGSLLVYGYDGAGAAPYDTAFSVVTHLCARNPEQKLVGPNGATAISLIPQTDGALLICGEPQVGSKGPVVNTPIFLDTHEARRELRDVMDRMEEAVQNWIQPRKGNITREQFAQVTDALWSEIAYQNNLDRRTDDEAKDVPGFATLARRYLRKLEDSWADNPGELQPEGNTTVTASLHDLRKLAAIFVRAMIYCGVRSRPTAS